jgi:hypothetical protein
VSSNPPQSVQCRASTSAGYGARGCTACSVERRTGHRGRTIITLWRIREACVRRRCRRRHPGVLAAFSPAQAAQVCVKADLNINGTEQNIEQCLPE